MTFQRDRQRATDSESKCGWVYNQNMALPGTNLAGKPLKYDLYIHRSLCLLAIERIPEQRQ